MTEIIGITPRNEIEREYLARLREGRFSTLFCDECSRARFYPRVYCPYCRAAGGTWRDLSGAGVLRTFTEVHRAPDPAFAVPYRIGVVALEEDVSVMARIEDCALSDLRVGLAMRICVRRFEPWQQPLPVAVPVLSQATT